MVPYSQFFPNSPAAAEALQVGDRVTVGQTEAGFAGILLELER